MRFDNSQPVWTFFPALCIAAFAFNWLWEMLQMRAYVEMASSTWSETVPRCTVAALGDVLSTRAGRWSRAVLAI